MLKFFLYSKILPVSHIIYQLQQIHLIFGMLHFKLIFYYRMNGSGQICQICGPRRGMKFFHIVNTWTHEHILVQLWLCFIFKVKCTRINPKRVMFIHWFYCDCRAVSVGAGGLNVNHVYILDYLWFFGWCHTIAEMPCSHRLLEIPQKCSFVPQTP